MYPVQILIRNPMTGGLRTLDFVVDPTRFPVESWDKTYLPVSAAVTELAAVEAANPVEPL